MHKLIACTECDLLIKQPNKVVDGAVMICPRCDNKILSSNENIVERTLALSSTALIMLLIAISFPFLGFNAEGKTGSISILEASFELFNNGAYFLAILVMLLIVVLPASYFSLLLILLISNKFAYVLKSRIMLGHLIAIILPWLMADVFLIGAMVALIKLLDMAQVIFGASFWAYVAFTVLYLKTAKLVDNHQLWTWVDRPEN